MRVMTCVRTGPVAYLYVVGASSDPNHVTCCVPWRVDDREIYFGPCKKRLREHLKKTLLGDRQEVRPSPDIYLVGFNALPSPAGPRTVVWAGRMTRAMTFARAADLFVGKRYEAMLATQDSPLNVLPVRDGEGRLRGYQFRPNGDHPHDWPADLVVNRAGVTLEGDRLLLRPGVSPAEGFGRDLGFTLDNLFFADGKGLVVDDQLVAILEAAQPGTAGIDKVAVFGRTADRQPNGLRGRYLTISDPDLVDQLVAWVRDRAPTSTPSKSRRTRSCCRRETP